MADGKFSKPARKLHAKDVLALENRGGSWYYSEDELSFVVQIIWIQGAVVAYNQEKSEVTLQDNGYNVTVTNCHIIPGGNAWIDQGKYVMAVGELDNNSTVVKIRAIKIADLSDNSVHQQTWNDEVTELKALMRENKPLCR
ncbi:recQ-mediated genome instability protein 2-like [Macrobrachium nipponense]|uniref:recQ-mediated genome instability protein 2-like n=1 Tax=Macrobrachium nipponense TaxID=159736 RepID=UPI0030C7CE77